MQTAQRISTDYKMSKAEDVKSLMAYSHYIIMKAQLIGNLCFDGHKPNDEENRVAEECRLLCDKISRKLNISRISDVPELLDYYDIAFRIGNKTLPDKAFISGHKKRVLKAWKAEDREIAESTVYGIIAPEVAYHPERADREYLSAYQSIKQKWIATLRRFDHFPDATSYENYQRLALMMRENIDRELGGDSNDIKRRWYSRNHVEDLSKLSSQILKSYRRFASSLFPHVLDYKEQMDRDNQILTELTSRIDLIPNDREAFRLALQYNTSIL